MSIRENPFVKSPDTKKYQPHCLELSREVTGRAHSNIYQKALEDSFLDKTARKAASQRLLKDKQTYQVKDSILKITKASQNLAQVTNQSEQSLNRQRSEIDMIANAADEMSAMVKSVAANATKAANFANQIDSEANNGSQVVSKTIKSIDNLASEVETSAEVILALRNESEGISSVLHRTTKLLTPLFVAGMLCLSGADAGNYDGNKVLYIDSYHAGNEWSDGITAGVEKTLANTGVALKILDGKSPSEIPLSRNKGGNVVINLKMAETKGAEIPYSLIESATTVME